MKFELLPGQIRGTKEEINIVRLLNNATLFTSAKIYLPFPIQICLNGYFQSMHLSF